MLLVILLITTVSLIVFLFVGSLFLQGYIYTEPSQGLYWQAPAAGVVLGLFFTAWCWSVVQADSTPTDIPYDVLHRFSPRVYLYEQPVKELWAVKKDGQKVRYTMKKEVRFAGQSMYTYYDKNARPWSGSGVESIVIDHEGEPKQFDLVPTSEGAYRRFISRDGWIIDEYDTPTGLPTYFRFGRLLANLFFNFFHLLLWFLCFWLLLRFLLGHALGLAVVLWLVFTLTILPMLLSYAAEVSQARRAAPTTPVVQRTLPG